MLAAHLEMRAEMPFADYVRAGVCEPLGIALDPEGDPGSGMHASLDDVLAIASELLSPRLVAQETLDEMTAVHFPGLSGVLPDYGRFDPLDWGLGVQLNTRPPTWMGTRTSATDVRALRRLRDVPLGRPGGAGRVRGADRSRVRRLGEGSLARALRRRLGRARSIAPGRLIDHESGGFSRFRPAHGSPSSAKRGRSNSSKAAWSQLATTQGVIAVTVAVRGTFITSATSPKNSPARRIRRSPIDCCETPATPESKT